MKKILGTLAAGLLMVSSSFAQVLQKPGIINTSWTGFGDPLDASLMYYGLANTIQMRWDYKDKIIAEGMLNLSFLPNYDNDGDVDKFVFGTSNNNPLSLHYGYSKSTNLWSYDNSTKPDHVKQDSYYVNFFYNFNKNLQAGVGTKMNWRIGGAPSYGDNVFGPNAHVRQGGFSTAYDDRSGAFIATSKEDIGVYKYSPDAPGSADVVGFVPFANRYAKRALGFRVKSDPSWKVGLEAGLAIPNGFSTDDPAMNFGVRVIPTDWIAIGAALEGAFDSQANFYTGVDFSVKAVKVETYLACAGIFSKEDTGGYGLGAAVTFKIPKTKLVLRPEGGFNWFENGNYTPAWYIGALLNIPITDVFEFDAWASFAIGSSDKRWDDNPATDDYDGGHVFDMRPQLKINIKQNMALDVYFNLENRRAFDDHSRFCWSSGVYFTYRFDFK